MTFDKCFQTDLKHSWKKVKSKVEKVFLSLYKDIARGEIKIN